MKVVSLIVAIFFPLLTFAQFTPTYTRYNNRHGLPSDDVYGVVQDHHGFIWVYGFVGAVRFDGKKFIPLPNDVPEEIRTKTVRGIDTLHIQGQKKVFFEYTNKLASFDGKKWLFYTKIDENKNKIASDYYRCSQGIFLQKDDKLYQLQEESECFKLVTIHNLPQGKYLMSCGCSYSLILYFPDNNSYYYVTPTANSFLEWEAKKIDIPSHVVKRDNFVFHDEKNNSHYHFFHDEKNNFYYTISEGKLEKLSLPEIELLQKHFLNSKFTSFKIKKYASGEVAINVTAQNFNAGEYRVVIIKNKKLFWLTQHVKSAVLGLPFIDKEGNVWLATNDGLFNFHQLEVEEIRDDDRAAYLWSLVEMPNGNFWGSSFKNGNIYSITSSGIVTTLFTTKERWYMGSILDKRGRVLQTGRSLVYDTRKNNISYSHSHFSSMFVFEDTLNDRRLWGGANGDIFVEDKHFREKIIESKELDFMGSIICIAQMNDSTYLYGGFSMHGYLVYRPDETFRTVSIRPADSLGNPARYKKRGVQCAVKDYKGNIWIADLFGKEIRLIDGKCFNEHSYFTKKDLAEIENDCIRVISLRAYDAVGGDINSLVVKGKWLMAHCKQGVFLLDLEAFYEEGREHFQIWGDANGYTGDFPASQNSAIIDKNFDFWLPCNNTLLRISPSCKTLKNFNKLHSLPILLISGEYFDENLLKWETLFDYDVVTNDTLPTILAYQRIVRFTHRAITMTHPDLVDYRYRLIPQKNPKNLNWSEPYRENVLTMSKLPPGKYYLDIQARRIIDDEWTGQARFSIIVPFQWYEYWLARVGFGLLGVAVVWILVRKRIRTIKARAKEREEKLIAEKKVLTLRQSMQANQLKWHALSNYIAALRAMATNSKLVEEYALILYEKFRNMMRAVRETGQWSLEEELKVIENDVELYNLNYSKKIGYKKTLTPHDIDLSKYAVPALCLQTIAENAIHHGLHHLTKRYKQLRTHVIFHQDKGFFEIQIEDNGIGRKASAEINARNPIKKESIGSKVAKEQLKMFNSNNRELCENYLQYTDLFDEDGGVLGTRATIFLVATELSPKKENDTTSNTAKNHTPSLPDVHPRLQIATKDLEKI